LSIESAGSRRYSGKLSHCNMYRTLNNYIDVNVTIVC